MAGLNHLEERLISNPFHFSPAEPEEFVGRWPLVHEMAAGLTAGKHSYACVGGRRFGKTSVLFALRHTLWQQSLSKSNIPALPLLLDPTIARFASPDHFFATLLYEVRRRCDLRLSGPPGEPVCIRVPLDGTLADGLSPSDPPTITAVQFAEVMNVILDRLEDQGGPRRLIVLLDEVDSLLDYPWRRELFAQLRASLVSGDLRSRLRLVLAGSHRFLEEATDRGSPLWNVLVLQYLTALDERSTYELATPADGLAIDVTHAVWQHSGGHPFLGRYLLHHLWKAGGAATVADVGALAGQFIQQGAVQLEGWSKAIGLAGLWMYGLFVDTTESMQHRALVKAVNDPRVPVAQALTALCYHGMIIPNSTWSQYRRGGDLFRDWYVQEAPRLIAELTPPPPKEVIVGDKYDFSSASFTGSILNIKSHLDGAIQTVGAAENVGPSTQEQLQKLLEQLQASLKQVPPDKIPDAEAVATLARQAVEEATKEKPNKTMVQITGDGLKKAAENIGAAMPQVLEIASAIAAVIGNLVT